MLQGVSVIALSSKPPYCVKRDDAKDLKKLHGRINVVKEIMKGSFQL